MNRPPTGRPMGPRPGSHRESEPEREPRRYVVLQRKGSPWPHACVGPMEPSKAERAAASWRASGMIATVASRPIGVNLTNEMEAV